jgi:hypothetical protein
MIPHDTHLQIGSLLFEGVDQIDLTGPFEVLSRIPNSSYRIYGKSTETVRDLRGLRLTPDVALADAPQLDAQARQSVAAITAQREATARRVAAALGIAVPPATSKSAGDAEQHRGTAAGLGRKRG